MELKQFLMLMHFSQLAGFIVPFAGLILPIVMWSGNKDKNPLIDEHGKNIVNWMISSFIYAIVGGLLIFVFFVGIPVLFALAICSIVFAIMGGIKASNGEVYKYPLTITFIK